ncbi:hypothetical protein HYN59_15835 [Flavobacterium album]|uniref:SecDF P1 head subdomain domain-containing protein n=1 Tax=Flavobacterium album TaxID=2175091 RepID=A0A2S1R1D9_9FLAO|nr:hypothetical protein [Flavobacterium album]AWH86488.1 hypothetical protein HYN59_15835 [Flavobacterium album]
MTFIKNKIAAFGIFFMLTLSGCAQQPPCYQIKAEFTDRTASEKLKEATIEKIGKRLKERNLDADIKIENNTIIAKMPCEGSDKAPHCFYQDKFAIYETYQTAELNAAMDGIGRISDSIADNAPEIAEGYTAYVIRLEEILNREFAEGAVIGYCKTGRSEEFMKLVNLPQSKKLLPAGLSFVFGLPEKNQPAIAVYAVRNSDKAPVTIYMLEETDVVRSYNKINYDVMLQFKDNYKAAWAALTRKNTQKFLAIVLDGRVLSCPMVTGPIEGGKAAISANMDRRQADAMAERINTSLPLEVLITEVKLLEQK